MNRTRSGVQGAFVTGLLLGLVCPLQMFAVDLVWAPSGRTAEDWTWNTGVTASWKKGEEQSLFAEGDKVFFTSSEANVLASRLVTVSGSVSPLSLKVTGNGNYTFAEGNLIIGSELLMEGSGVLTFNTPFTTPKTRLSGGTFIFPGSFDAGDFTSPGGTVKAGGTGAVTFTFSAPEGQTREIRSNWNKGSSSGISLRKKGAGTSDIDIRKFFDAKGSGRVYVDEGTLVPRGYSWGSYSGEIIYEVAGGATLSSGGGHALGDYRSGIRIFLHPGGTFRPGREQYMGDANPGLWLMGNAHAYGGLRNKGRLYVKAEGKGNTIERLEKAYGNLLTVNVLDQGELYLGTVDAEQTVRKEGPGVLVVGSLNRYSDSNPIQITAGSLVATNSFTSLQSVPVEVSDGASFVNGTEGIFWIANTASSSTGTGAFVGSFGSDSETQNFSGNLTVRGSFALKGKGIQADYTGLSVDGYLDIDTGWLTPLSLPSTLSLDKVRAIRVVSGGEDPANLAGTTFSKPLELAAGAHALVSVGEGSRPVVLTQGVTFAPDSTLHLALEETLIPAGTYPVFSGVETLPAVLPEITGYLTTGGTAEWVVENGALAVKITQSGTIDTLKWRPVQGEGAELSWSGEVANWETPAGTPSVFIPGSPAIFDGEGSDRGGRIAVSGNMVVGKVGFSGPRDYTLVGEKLRGTSQVLKEGTGTLTVDGYGFSAQPLLVAGGILKLGENIATDALGNIGVPIEVKGGGTVDINYVGSDPNSPVRNKISHRKIFRIEGEGVGGRGALVNDGTNRCYRALSRVELTGDAAIGGSSRFDLRLLDGSDALQKRPLLTGAESTLTVKNRDAFGLIGTDVDLKKIIVSGGGIVRPEEDTFFTLAEGVELAGGTFNPYHLTADVNFPLRAVSGENRLVGENQGGTFRGPVTVEPDTLLELSGSTLNFYGSITNRGTLRVRDGEHSVYAPVWSSSPIEIIGGALNWGGNGKPEWPSLGNSRAFKIDNGLLRIFPSDFRSEGDLTLSGDSGSVLFLTPSVSGGIKLTNTVVRIGGGLGISNPWYYGGLILGEGCDVACKTLQLGENGANPKSSYLRLLPGSRFHVTGGDTRIGHWSGSSLSYNHSVTIEGGHYINTNSITYVGWDSPRVSLRMEGGRMDVKGICLRPDFNLSPGLNQGNTFERFVMNGGHMNLGDSGLVSSRTLFAGDSGVYLNGGTISNTVPWGTSAYLYVAFAGKPVTWDLGENLVNYCTALQGSGEVTLRGNAAFNDSHGNGGTIYARGSVRGHWTVENRGGTSLRNAAAFSGGLTLGEDVAASVDIRNAGYVRFGQYKGVKAAECEAQMKVVPYLDYAMPYAHGGMAEENTAYLYAGEFYVSSGQAGTWTFAESYDDRVYLSVDGNKVLDDESWDRSAHGQIEVGEGWHRFRLAVQQGTGGAGPVDSGWVGKGMGIGWTNAAVNTVAASAYTRFSPDQLPMRPGVNADDEQQLNGNSVSWSRHQGVSDNWKYISDWNTFGVTNTLKILSVRNWTPSFMSVNRFTGWFYVPEEMAGIWKFWGSYDDQCAIWVDGEDSGIDGNGNKNANRDFDLTPGWHAFEVRVYDKGGNCGPWNPADGAAIQYQVNSGSRKAFDESTLRFRASLSLPNTEYGFIGDVLELKAGSRLTNVAGPDTAPCAITGTLKGSGTLEGPYALSADAVWEIAAERSALTETVAFGRDRNPDTLKDLREVRVFFSGRPLRTTYEVSDALGLEKVCDPESGNLPGVRVVATDPTGKESYPFRASVRGDKFILVNRTPPGTVFILD